MGISVGVAPSSQKLVLLETITVTGASHTSGTLPVYAQYYVEMVLVGSVRITFNSDSGANYGYRNLTTTGAAVTAAAAYVPVNSGAYLGTMQFLGKVPTGGASIHGFANCGNGAGTATTDFNWAAAAGTQVQTITFANMTVIADNFIRIYGVVA